MQLVPVNVKSCVVPASSPNIHLITDLAKNHYVCCGLPPTTMGFNGQVQLEIRKEAQLVLPAGLAQAATLAHTLSPRGTATLQKALKMEFSLAHFGSLQGSGQLGSDLLVGKAESKVLGHIEDQG